MKIHVLKADNRIIGAVTGDEVRAKRELRREKHAFLRRNKSQKIPFAQVSFEFETTTLR